MRPRLMVRLGVRVSLIAALDLGYVASDAADVEYLQSPTAPAARTAGEDADVISALGEWVVAGIPQPRSRSVSRGMAGEDADVISASGEWVVAGIPQPRSR